MSRTALVTGAGGFVGPHLVRELRAHGWSVVTTDRGPRPDSLPADVEHVAADLCEPASLSGIADIDAVVHLAGLSRVAESFTEPQRYLQVNTAALTTVAEELLRRGSGARVLVISTGALYDTSRPGPLSEDAALACASPYAVSKAAMEHQVDYYVRRGLDAVVVRPFNHIGPGQGPGFLLGDLVAGLRAIRGSDAPLVVGDLDTARDYTDVRDVCRAYRLLLEADALPHRVFNVCSGTPTTGRALLAELVAAGGFPTPTLQVDPARVRPTDPRVVAGDAGRLHAATGWKPERTVADSVRDLVALSLRG
ncbi:NAD-dependent epimerase/dehydratase family protein [Nocardioides massiliensis]|uniref:GDP-4-dehydro-6-deoxy-D-mannose reductase n=1 Tax=Nocardioides massiliensis TaxID=1325935 RepID=A0ABT9NMV8_9ACTN|nr:NAD-dependent epimerase/dehydratase family protein [Nocardioides massiliensis]MDP9821767.1 GDP-4-dehydro-6-deoxy-D-mannose reductase [Nocardioides massiliensis]